MRLEREGGRFVAHTQYSERHIPKGAGFRWDPQAKVWWTDDEGKALKLIDYAEPAAVEALQQVQLQVEESLELSRATDAEVEIPAPEGLEYLPFQRAGIAYGLSHPNVLIADEMGLGKTIQAIGIANAADSESILVICPASLKLNWKRELEKWMVRPREICVANGKFIDTAPVCIINYDILKKHSAALRSRTWDLLIIDEGHYLKNPKAQRTAEVYGRYDREPSKVVEPIPAKRRVVLTGTPIVNRPAELWTAVKALDPEGLGQSWHKYHTTYCDAHRTRWGWDLTGHSNLDELQLNLRKSIMVRRLKADVLTELPPKRRQLIPVEASKAYLREEKKVLAGSATLQALAKAAETGADYEQAVARLEADEVAFEEMSSLRRLAAMEKLPHVLSIIAEYVEAEEPVLVFAHHHDVIDAIRDELGKLNVSHGFIDGRVSNDERQQVVDDFQAGKIDVFIGGILAAGVGITLTRASNVIFAELDWVPGNVSQAEDRAHRIGQTSSVNVTHIVLDESIEATLAQTIVAKQQTISQALDDEVVAPKAAPGSKYQSPEEEEQERAREREERRARTRTRRVHQRLSGQSDEVLEEVIPAPVVEALMEGVSHLAALDPDWAEEENGLGFSKADGYLGHSLAEERTEWTQDEARAAKAMLRKYRGQLGEELHSRIYRQEEHSA